MATNLPAYNFRKADELTFFFVTDNGAEYKCSFLSYAEYFANYPVVAANIFSFNLDFVNSKEKFKGVDKRIAATVIKIVGDFLLSKVNAVVYVCDNSDGREAARARKFLSWFDYDAHPSHQIIKVSGDFNAGGITLYTALLVHRKNKLKKQLVEAYLDLIDYDDDK